MPAFSKATTYYEILEVSPNASQAVIRAAYKSLMQRSHPDKNSGDLQMEQQTILIGQAFDVLSDPEKRKAYDFELKQNGSRKSPVTEKSPRAEGGAMTTQQNNQPNASQVFRQVPLDKNFPFSSVMLWVVGLLVLLTIGSKVFTSPENQAAVQAERQQPTEQMKAGELTRLAAEKDAKEETARKLAESKIARTIPNLALSITVKMPPTKNGFNHCSEFAICTHYIKTSALGIIVHTNDHEKIIQHIQKNRDLIVEGIKTELGRHLYTDLNQVNGEEKLKKIILEKINRTIVGYENYRFSDISQFKGVEEILLPESFSIH